MTDEVGAPPSSAGAGRSAPAPWEEFWSAPWPARLFLLVSCAAALVLPIALHDIGPTGEDAPAWLTALVLVAISVLNVEIGRFLAGGLSHTHQPHKALSAWAFSSALLLPTPWLLVIVPITYAHTRWRGLRLPLWKWIGSAGFLVLAGVAAALVRHAISPEATNWLHGNGGRGFLTMVAAAAAFLAVESLLFVGPATLNRREDEVWLRRTLVSPSYYATEAGVLLIGGLLSAVWTGGAWYVLLFLPIYALAQRAALHDPLRERAETAAELATKNHELELANEFKIDLMGMLGHEIANPLTSITGYAQMGSEALREHGDVALARTSLEVVERNATQIRIVLDEILATVSSDRGALTARREEVLVEPHCAAAASDQPAGRRPAVECESGLRALVQPGHLDQILANLLSNADKYGGGATRITVVPAADGDVEVAVVDAGPGVPVDFRDSLFQRFSRSADMAERALGTGLGLFISRELARANGGDLVYRDGQPSGAVFVVTLAGVDGADG